MSVIITFLKKNKGHIVIRTSGRVSAVAIRKIQKSLQMSEHLLAAQLIDILKSRSVPSKTMTEVSHLLANDDEEDVHISANRRYVVFTTAGYTIMSRLIEGEFLNYRNVIPAGSRTRVTIDTKDFISTIERASLIITERLKNPLRISFTEGKVVVRCQTNLGRVVDEFSAACEGDEVEIGFNNRYLLDALRNARTEQVRMEISGPLSPVKVLPVEGNDFLYLVLPVRFKND